MTRKDKFLRAIQIVEAGQRLDMPLTFRWALNLSEQGIPLDLHEAARRFALQVSK
ncbi:MAG: hypothetical protein JWQ04_481 [Pedosphaera sp.]|nr:hypothetical protein [Pedosphaera sp.]